MSQPLMPKATAVWLVENTALSFEQISAFCGLHPLEVQGIADGEVAIGIRGLDPVLTGQLTKEEIERCEKDPSAHLTLVGGVAKGPAKQKRGRYTPVSKRHERPNAIAWLLRNYPMLSDSQVGRLLGTTPATIAQVRNRTHWNAQNISPQDPILLGLCSEQELLEQINVAKRREARAAERAEKAAKKAEKAAEKPAAEAEAASTESPPSSDGEPGESTSSEASSPDETTEPQGSGESVGS